MGIGHFVDALSSFLAGGDGFDIPFGQVLIFVVVNSFCLLMGKHKLGLLITYCFVLFWGFISNREYFIDHFGHTSWGLVVYVLSGILMVIVLIIGFFQPSRD
ncbi:MAG: hypothetical protein ABSB95_11570 [Dissulfurispiraceae bacterium]|jgi:hypothetical protein